MRADTVEEMFDLAMAFSHQPVPRGNRVAIVTNAGGPGIIIADACEAHGLVVTELSEATRALLAEHFPEEASLTNPVDMIASATPQSYRIAVEAVLADPNVDAVIATFVPPLGVRQEDVAEAIVSVAAGQTEKPVMAVLMGREGLPQGLAELNAAGIPGYRFPESGVRALAAMYRYRRWLERPVGEVRTLRRGPRGRWRASSPPRKAEGREKLSETEVMRVLEAYGIPVAPYARRAHGGRGGAGGGGDRLSGGGQGAVAAHHPQIRRGRRGRGAGGRGGAARGLRPDDDGGAGARGDRRGARWRACWCRRWWGAARRPSSG